MTTTPGKKQRGGGFCRWAASLLLTCVLMGGCAWRTQSKAYCVGPFLTRTGGTERNINQRVFLPLQLQAGRQCSLSVGWENQISSLETPGRTEDTENPRWRLRFWQVLPLADVPEFSRNRFLGARLQAGTDQTGASLGYASSVEIRPQRDGLYRLSFDSNQPMATEFKYWRDVPAGFAFIIKTKGKKP